MFRSLNISKFSKGPLNSSADFDFLMRSMQREREKEKENSSLFNRLDSIDTKSKKKGFSSTVFTHSKLSSPRPNNEYQAFISKVAAFVQITLKLLEIEQIKSSAGLVKQIKQLGSYIQGKMDIMCNMSSISSVPGGNGEVERLLEVEKQNEELKELIHSHELANIRMHIKINDGESEDIELFKRNLEQSYASYRKLGDKVVKYKAKIKQLHLENSAIIQENSGIAQENSRHKKNIENLEAVLKRKVEQLSKQKHVSANSVELEEVIEEQNNEMERMYNSLKEIIEKHEEKETMWSQEVLRYKARIRELQKRGLTDMKRGPTDMDSTLLTTTTHHDNEYLRFVLLQASALEKLVG